MTKTNAKDPFVTLGTSDDGYLNFIDAGNRLHKTTSRSLNKGFLLSLADLEHWEGYPLDKPSANNKVNWDLAISCMIENSRGDFDTDNVKGVGAWRSEDGKICFHSGNPYKVKGNYPDEWVFLRKTAKDIGIGSKPPSLEDRLKLIEVIKSMPFEKWQEGVRLVCWATLGFAAGSMNWRCSGLLTGASKSGKSVIINMIVRALTGPTTLFVSGSSTEAGIRQNLAADARPVIIEESEADTMAERMNRDGHMKLMRQSTTDDTPELLKGGKDGVSQSFALKSMFLFAGITPQVEHEADSNRLFRVNIKKAPNGGDKNWKSNKEFLKKFMTPENTRGIRALTWECLPKIIEFADVIEGIIQNVTGHDGRFATAEAPLISAYIVIWLGKTKISIPEITKLIEEFYSDFEYEKVDETEEFIDRLLNKTVTITETRERFSLRQMLTMLHSGVSAWDESPPDSESDIDKIEAAAAKNTLSDDHKRYFKQTLYSHGIVIAPVKKFTSGTAVGFAKNNDLVMRLMDTGKGYHDTFKRHDGFLNGNYPITVLGQQHAYVVIDNILGGGG